MPNLRKAELDALTASIRRFGVVMPVVVDQHGEVIDGNNRTVVATQLGVNVPRQVYPCDPTERDALRVELNAARRQLSPKQWEPMVDHLRQQGHSDRAIATVLGVNKNKVNQYQSPVPGGVPGGTPTVSTGRVGEDGKRYPAPGQQSQRDRLLQVLRQNHPKFYTAGELGALGIPTGGISSVLSKLVRDGLVRRKGRQRSYQFQGIPEAEVAPPPAPSDEPELTAKEVKAYQLLDQATEVTVELKGILANTKAQRQARSLLLGLQQEDDRNQVEQEKQRRRLVDTEINLALSRGELWHALRLKLDRLAMEVGQHCRDFSELPYPAPEAGRLLDWSLANLREYLDLLETKLYPGGTNRMGRGTTVDAHTREQLSDE
jgi:ParB-like chromosome segregation protein Spo0J